MAKYDFSIPGFCATLLLLFAITAIADERIRAPAPFGSNTAIANGPIGSVLSDLTQEKSDIAKIKAKIACTRRLIQAGGDRHCLAALQSLGRRPQRKCCLAMADVDQEAPECWDYLIGGPQWNKHLLTLNELCVPRPI